MNPADLDDDALDERNRNLRWCWGCPDHEACGQGMCYLNNGPTHPAYRCPTGGCGICAPLGGTA